MSSKKRRRREDITALVHEHGAVTVGSLAERFDVSMQTIRRDVDALCEGEMLHRSHGRIGLSKEFLNTPFDQRAGTNRSGKRSIAQATAELIPDGSTIFISIGSTPLSVANALSQHKDLTVITNNVSVAMALSSELSNRIILSGGELRLPDKDILGDEVVEFFGRFRADFALFGVAGISEDGGLLDFHTSEVRARQKIRENAKKSLLVVDASKFGRQAPALGDNISEMDRVIIDRMPSETYTPLLKDLNDRLVIAQGEPV